MYNWLWGVIERSPNRIWLALVAFAARTSSESGVTSVVLVIPSSASELAETDWRYDSMRLLGLKLGTAEGSPSRTANRVLERGDILTGFCHDKLKVGTSDPVRIRNCASVKLHSRNAHLIATRRVCSIHLST